jgi:hypothetical protein
MRTDDDSNNAGPQRRAGGRRVTGVLVHCKIRGQRVRIKFTAVTISLLALVTFASVSLASSDAGLDVTFSPVQLRVVYSVALDYEGADNCIRDPRQLLFDIIALFQAHPSKPKLRQEVLQFELYQNSKKAGNLLSLVRDPFEGGQYKKLFDGRANQDMKQQILSLLKQQLKLPPSKEGQPTAIRLYKCVETKSCDDILFGSFPSKEMHTGYCATPGKGCDSNFISATRDQMNKLFIAQPE